MEGFIYAFGKIGALFPKMLKQNKVIVSVYGIMDIFELSFWHPQTDFNSQKLDDW